jgi:hypothetical protein
VRAHDLLYLGVMGRLLVAVAVAFALTVSPASAANRVSCGRLAAALENAEAGEVITLKDPVRCGGPFPYMLPAVPVTLKGVPGAGFKGGHTAQLAGTTASATIEGLTFEGANNTGSGGGALSVNAAGGAQSFTLAKDSFTNDVAGGGEGGGALIDTPGGAVTITESTFTGDSAHGDGGGLAILAASATLSGDTFSSDSAGADGHGGGLMLQAETVTLSGSLFNNDTATDAGGGAQISTLAGGGVGATLSGDTFTDNSVADPAAANSGSEGYLGGGLALLGAGAEPTSAVQSGDTFDSNSVSFKPAARSAMGAGEAISRVALQSTGDHFTSNTLQSPDEASNEEMNQVFGRGAGLSLAACPSGAAEAPTGAPLTSTLVDAVVAGNTLISGPSAAGAGIYAGFGCAAANTALQLEDSTVAGNVVASGDGPIAGIGGGPNDVLSLANTILADDSGGAELGGFMSPAGISAAYSDVCSEGAPLGGAGNICADPRLVSPGPGSADVHETGVSPTLGAGSNALIPGGLTTDAFGEPRIAGPFSCAATPTPIVDIGADELAYPPISCPLARRTAARSNFVFMPMLLGLTQSARTWREGKLLAHVSSASRKPKKKPPIGTTFSFTLSEPATLTLVFSRPAGGRLMGSRCVAQTKKNEHNHRCTRTLIGGRLHLSAHLGKNKVRFQGRISKNRKLMPGHTFALAIWATVSGHNSLPRALHFTIAR